jgi:putative FmdB family regulatory protein
MPVYDYDCLECGRRVEVIHGVHGVGPTHCPNCGGGPLKKAITAAAVHYKGSGWAKKERRATVAPGASSAGEGSTESEGKSGDTKNGDAKGTDGKGSDGKGSSGSETSSGGSTDKASDRPAAEIKASSSKSAGTGTATKTD